MHYPTRKFVQINELCSHFYSQKRKKKEKEIRKSRTSIFAFRKEDSSGLSSRRGGKVKRPVLLCGIFRKLLTRKEERYQQAGVHDLSSPRATTRRCFSRVCVSATGHGWEHKDILNAQIYETIMFAER